jgi:hypothetical protein
MIKKILLLIIIITVISGCTVCEKPYLKVDGKCCLDENDNSVCDDNEIIDNKNEEIDVKNADEDKLIEKETIGVEKDLKEEIKNEKNEMFILDFEINKINLVSNYYQPVMPKDAKFIITTAKADKITEVTVSFIPMCKEDDNINIFLNEKLIGTIPTICEKINKMIINKEYINEGINQFQFSTTNNDYKIENGTILLKFNGLEDQEQQIEKFDIGNDKEKSKLNSNNKVVIRNYNDMKFKLDKNEFAGDISISLNIVEEGQLYIYINNFEIYNNKTSGKIELNLPQDKLKIGTNVLRYLVIP